MRRATATAALALLPLLAGCLAGESPVLGEAAGWLPPGVYQVTEHGVEPLPDHPALSNRTSNGPGVRVDLLQLMRRDTMTAVAIELLDAGTGDNTQHSAVSLTPKLVGEGGGSGDYCNVGFFDGSGEFQGHVYGDVPLLRHLWDVAHGRAGNASLEDPAMSGFMGSGDTSNPAGTQWSISIGHTDGNYVNGSWFLALAGTSGVPIGPDAGEWWVEIAADVRARVYLLPDMPFFCGTSFDRFAGATGQAPATVVGGSWEMDPAPAGATLAFAPRGHFGALAPFNAASLVIGDRQHDAAGAEAIVDVRPTSHPIAIHNEQWTGLVLWIAAGLPVPDAQGWVDAVAGMGLPGPPMCWRHPWQEARTSGPCKVLEP